MIQMGDLDEMAQPQERMEQRHRVRPAREGDQHPIARADQPVPSNRCGHRRHQIAHANPSKPSKVTLATNDNHLTLES
ncbi:hypothetical protein D3C78_1667700 [compost metagenome]